MLLIIFDTDEKLQRLLQIVAILTLLSKAKQIGIVENFPTRRLLEVLLKILQWFRTEKWYWWGNTKSIVLFFFSSPFRSHIFTSSSSRPSSSSFPCKTKYAPVIAISLILLEVREETGGRASIKTTHFRLHWNVLWSWSSLPWRDFCLFLTWQDSLTAPTFAITPVLAYTTGNEGKYEKTWRGRKREWLDVACLHASDRQLLFYCIIL